jgi:biotin carboxylase
MSKLAIIGASYLQLPLVLAAKKRKITTVCFSWEEGAVCKQYCDKFYPISILDKEKIFDECVKEKISGITTIASDIAVPTICYISEKLGLTGNSFESSIVCTNKFLQRKKLKEAEIQIPFFANSTNFDFESLKQYLKFPVIVKPVDRSGSKGVIVVSSPDKLDDGVRYAQNESLCGQAIIEEFIEGEEISVEAISWEGNHSILAFTDKVTTGPPHFVELEHHQPSRYWQSNVHELIISTVKHSLSVLGIKYGASHSELIITKEGEVFVTEIGARMGGDFIGSHLVKLSTGFDFLDAVIDVALNEEPKVKITTEKYAGVCFYSKESEWVEGYIKSKSPSIVEWHLDVFNETILKESSQRSGYFIYAWDQKIEQARMLSKA